MDAPARLGHVEIREIGPRLTFQAHEVPTSIKVEFVNRLADAGVRAIEVSSFVKPGLVPGLADAEEVFSQVARRDGVSYECCVGNLQGLRRAVDAGADRACFLLSANEEFSRRNIGRSVAAAIGELERLAEFARGQSIRVATYVVGAFGGPVGGALEVAVLEELLRRLKAVGVTDWILADSFGYASPAQIAEVVAGARRVSATARVSVQVHDTRGMGVANAAELARLGIAQAECSIGGSGGHPAMPGAHVGGVCTEDVVQLLSLMGFVTGVNLPALIAAADWLAGVGVPLAGFVRHAGPVPGGPVAAVSAHDFDFDWVSQRSH